MCPPPINARSTISVHNELTEASHESASYNDVSTGFISYPHTSTQTPRDDRQEVGIACQEDISQNEDVFKNTSFALKTVENRKQKIDNSNYCEESL